MSDRMDRDTRKGLGCLGVLAIWLAGCVMALLSKCGGVL